MKSTSQKLNRWAKMNYSHSQAHKDLTASGFTIDFVTFSEIWDMSKNVKGEVNFSKLGVYLDGYAIGFKSGATATTAKSDKADKQTATA